MPENITQRALRVTNDICDILRAVPNTSHRMAVARIMIAIVTRCAFAEARGYHVVLSEVK